VRWPHDTQPHRLIGHLGIGIDFQNMGQSTASSHLDSKHDARGRFIQTCDRLPMEEALQEPNLVAPKQKVTVHRRPSIEGLRRLRVDVLRPVGFSVATAGIRV
jgi:hypothetical protein